MDKSMVTRMEAEKNSPVQWRLNYPMALENRQVPESLALKLATLNRMLRLLMAKSGFGVDISTTVVKRCAVT